MKDIYRRGIFKAIFIAVFTLFLSLNKADATVITNTATGGMWNATATWVGEAVLPSSGKVDLTSFAIRTNTIFESFDALPWL
jgi:hypothetical protein